MIYEVRPAQKIHILPQNRHSTLIIFFVKFGILVAAASTGIISQLNFINRIISLQFDSPWLDSSPSSQFILKLKESLEAEIYAKSLPFSPLVITKDGNILCKRHENEMDHPDAKTLRMLSIADMIRAGLEKHHPHLMSKFSHIMTDSLPLFLMPGDIIGCNVATGKDYFDFPRLTWSVPSNNAQGGGWCHAISVPTYQSWGDFGKGKTPHNRRRNNKLYPWNSKISKAVWRGSSTFDPNQYGNVSFHDIPRAKLVQTSMDHPDVIDAAFYRFHPRFGNITEEITPTTIVTDYIPFNDQMKYKAIIDIDGNNWSSRFSRLLCTNSVVIKIAPDFIEYFYDDLIPGVHYIPASLENVTEVTKYVLDESNELQMKNVVQEANLWCERRMTRKSIANDAMDQLESYLTALDTYIEEGGWQLEWKQFIRSDPFDNLEEC